MSKATATFETEEEFTTAEPCDIHVLRDSTGEVWMTWDTEDGDWYAIRPRNEDDPKGRNGDVARPVGPTPIGNIPFPVAVIDVHKALPKGYAADTRPYYPDEYELSDSYAGLSEDVKSKSYDEAYADAERGLNDLKKCAWAEGSMAGHINASETRPDRWHRNPYREQEEA